LFVIYHILFFPWHVIYIVQVFVSRAFPAFPVACPCYNFSGTPLHIFVCADCSRIGPIRSTIQSIVMLRAQEILSARISNNNIKHKQVDQQCSVTTVQVMAYSCDSQHHSVSRRLHSFFSP